MHKVVTVEWELYLEQPMVPFLVDSNFLLLFYFIAYWVTFAGKNLDVGRFWIRENPRCGWIFLSGRIHPYENLKRGGGGGRIHQFQFLCTSGWVSCFHERCLSDKTFHDLMHCKRDRRRVQIN